VTRPGLTFDTGMLIALERRSQRAWNVYREAVRRQVSVTVPAVVWAEWWRGRTEARQRIRVGLRVEWLSDALAEVAGEALATIPNATTIDAIVMTSAALRGDVVYTSDRADFERLQAHFPTVRVFGV
jgi:predicted nucleic acid-binding protein